jgi:hypothetical protein
LIDCLRMLIDSPIEVESSCCESLVGLLTRALSIRSCLPRVPTPVAFFAPVLRAYSGVGRAGFPPASPVNQTSRVITQSTGRSQAKIVPRSVGWGFWGDLPDLYSSLTALAGSSRTARFAGTQAASKAAQATSNDPAT